MTGNRLYNGELDGCLSSWRHLRKLLALLVPPLQETSYRLPQNLGRKICKPFIYDNLLL